MLPWHTICKAERHELICSGIDEDKHLQSSGTMLGHWSNYIIEIANTYLNAYRQTEAIQDNFQKRCICVDVNCMIHSKFFVTKSPALIGACCTMGSHTLKLFLADLTGEGASRTVCEWLELSLLVCCWIYRSKELRD